MKCFYDAKCLSGLNSTFFLLITFLILVDISEELFSLQLLHRLVSYCRAAEEFPVTLKHFVPSSDTFIFALRQFTTSHQLSGQWCALESR